MNITNMHNGIDLASKKGTPIYAAAGGRIIIAEKKGGYGKTFTQDRTEGLLEPTKEFFDVTRTLADPVLAPFRSSGTAENQAFSRLTGGGVFGGAAQLGQSVVTGAVAGSPRGAATAGGLLMPGGPIAGRLGGEAGPSVIDQLISEQFNQNQQ